MNSVKIFNTRLFAYIIFRDGSRSSKFCSKMDGVCTIAQALAQGKLTEEEADILILKVEDLSFPVYDEELVLEIKSDDKEFHDFGPLLN